MDWGTLASTGLGAVIGAGSSIVANVIIARSHRDDRAREIARESFVAYLGAMSRTTHQLRALREHNLLTPEERVSEADGILTESGAYERRQEVHIVAPSLEEHTEQAFEALRALRDRVVKSESAASDDAERKGVIDQMTVAIKALRAAMHDYLAKRT